MQTLTVDIDDLYPYEDSAKQSTYRHFLKLYKEQQPKSDVCDSRDSECRHVTLRNINGLWLVTNGSSRVLAAKNAGFKRITAVESTAALDPGRKLLMENTLSQRSHLDQKGFENYEATR